MIGICCGIRARAQDAADLEAVQHRQIEVQDDQVGRLIDHRLERGVAARHHVDNRVAIAFERVFDQTGDVLFVFDDQNPRRVCGGLPGGAAAGDRSASEL